MTVKLSLGENSMVLTDGLWGLNKDWLSIQTPGLTEKISSLERSPSKEHCDGFYCRSY